MVEPQFRQTTVNLTDGDIDRAALLERLVDVQKPPRPTGVEFEPLHYLLYTPFRYPPLDKGSRFASRHDRSLWYGALERLTSLAEKAYYQLRFHLDDRQRPRSKRVELTVFRTDIQTSRAIDLRQSAFDAFRSDLCSPVSYRHSCPFGRSMREHGVEAIVFPSARRPTGTNLGLFTPRAFADPEPIRPFERWAGTISDDRVVLTQSPADLSSAIQSVTFQREQFEVDGQIPSPTA